MKTRLNDRGRFSLLASGIARTADDLEGVRAIQEGPVPCLNKVNKVEGQKWKETRAFFIPGTFCMLFRGTAV